MAKKSKINELPKFNKRIGNCNDDSIVSSREPLRDSQRKNVIIVKVVHTTKEEDVANAFDIEL